MSSPDRGPLLGGLLRFAYHASTEEFTAWLSRSAFKDLQPAHSAAVQPLWELQEGARITALAQHARITKQSMSALVDHLEARGYVERVTDPADARATLVRLTARGRAYGREVRAFARKLEEEWASRIGAGRVRDLRGALEALREALLTKA